MDKIDMVLERLQRIETRQDSLKDALHKVDKDVATLDERLVSIDRDMVKMSTDTRVKGLIKYGATVLISALVSVGAVNALGVEENPPTVEKRSTEKKTTIDIGNLEIE